MGNIFGRRRRAPAPVDVVGEWAIKRDNALAAQEERFRQRLEQEQQQLRDSLIAAGAAERQRREAEFERVRKEQADALAAERVRFDMERIKLNEDVQKTKDQLAKLTAQLEKDVKDRENKMKYVNDLELPIRQINSLLLVGPKGFGKSTFMWLLGRGEEPSSTFGDGSPDILKLNGYIDTIGIRGWTPEELAKLLVLLIYVGIPTDIIIFSNDRVMLPITSLGLVGINNPMIVMLSTEFWANYRPGDGESPTLKLKETSDGVKRLDEEIPLRRMYNMRAYQGIEEMCLGKPITHHDNLEKLASDRAAAGVHPFQYILETLGERFSIAAGNDSGLVEMLFRFIFIFEKKYKMNKLNFMNSATLSDFDACDLVD